MVLSSGPDIRSEGTNGGEEEEEGGEDEEEEEGDGTQGSTRISRYLSVFCSFLEPVKKLRDTLFDHSSIAEEEKGKPQDGR